MNIEELEASIQYYAEKYYLGSPEISDAQFDMLVDKLRQLKPDSKVLKTGWGFEVIGDKVKHKYSHIGSLDKTKSYEDIPNRFKEKTIYISPKLDGLSAVVYYENGRLVKGVTRGNGEYGKDITDKLKLILGDTIFNNKFTGAVRGELIISDTNWNLLQQKYKNLIAPRNFAAGIINRKDIDEDIKYIDLVVYKIVGQENKPIYSKRDDILKWLDVNFKHSIPEYYYPVLNEASWNAYHKETYDNFRTMGYGLDGLVLTNADVQYNTQTQGYVYDEVAFKFEAEKTTTKIKQIEWELSRTQRMIPVAVVEPVELSGAVINRATCNNAKMVLDLGLGKDAEVVITRSNEVIPQILEVINISSEDLPTNCPKCDSPLVWEGVDLKCNNKACINIQQSDLQQWCESIGETEGLQWTLMKQYLDNYNISTIQDLYSNKSYVLNDLNSRSLSITESKIKQFFEKLYIEPVDATRALLALNIPRLGEKTAYLLAQNRVIIIDLFIYCYNLKYKGVAGISDPQNKLLELVKDATTQSIYDNKDKIVNLRYLFSDDFKTNRMVFVDASNDITYIAVTGSLQSMKRKDFEKYIREYGYELSSNLKKCKYLINNDISSTSTKNKQAKEYNIPIITEQAFINLLK